MMVKSDGIKFRCFPLSDTRTYEVYDEDENYFYAQEYLRIDGKIQYLDGRTTIYSRHHNSKVSHVYNEQKKYFERINIFDCELKERCACHDKEYDKCEHSFCCTVKNKCFKNYFEEM
ncbi:MAG TPA: hypothetical protein PKW30_07965 [Campylobacterales bacterium]|nr:hypothetical protein [Campylobacterales bacterium]